MSHESDISPLTRLVARIDRMSANQYPPDSPLPNDQVIVPSGFPSLDRALGGGFRRGDLIAIGGDDSAGCSTLLLAIALRASTRTLLLSSEMPAERVYERALSMSAKVPLESIQLGNVSPDERTRLATAALALRNRIPVVETITNDSLQEISAAIEASQGSPIVIVDALEGMLQRDHLHSEALTHSVLTLKRLALKHNIAVILATHLPNLDRQRPDRRPRLADFGLGGSIGSHADLVLGLFREELYDGDLGVTGGAELLILKHRHGPRSYVDLYFDSRFGRFEDVLEE